MAVFTKINDFAEDLLSGVHNFTSDTIQIALSNTAPASETSNPISDGNGILANVTQISYTNYADDLTVDRVMEGVTVSGSSGQASVDFNDFIVTPSGGSLADFRYVYVFNQTATNDPLIAVFDVGSTVSLASGESWPVTVSVSEHLTLS